VCHLIIFGPRYVKRLYDVLASQIITGQPQVVRDVEESPSWQLNMKNRGELFPVQDRLQYLQVYFTRPAHNTSIAGLHQNQHHMGIEM
jgi:hypothetical protein